jgi:hypothetical protein
VATNLLRKDMSSQQIPSSPIRHPCLLAVVTKLPIGKITKPKHSLKQDRHVSNLMLKQAFAPLTLKAPKVGKRTEREISRKAPKYNIQDGV